MNYATLIDGKIINGRITIQNLIINKHMHYFSMTTTRGVWKYSIYAVLKNLPQRIKLLATLEIFPNDSD